MNQPRLPSLTLYSPRNKQHIHHYQSPPRAEVAKLLYPKEAQIMKIKSQVYLQGRQRELKYLVSPSKYKRQAERVVRRKNNRLKAPQLDYMPKRIPVCCECLRYRVYHNKNKCSCEYEQPPIKRYVSQQRKSMPAEQLSPRPRRKSKKKSPSQVVINENQLSGTQEQINLTFSDSASQVNIEEANEGHQEYLSKWNQYKAESHRDEFMREVKKKQRQMEEITGDSSQSSRLRVDFTGLEDAKKQYIEQQRKLIDRLNHLIESRGR